MKTLNTKILPLASFRFTALATAFLVGGGLFLATSVSRADPQDDAAFTCASAVNVMDCIQKTGTGAPAPKAADITAVPVSTQALGFSGPITAGIRYDNYLAWILDVGYSQQFYNAAAAFKLSAGLNERRANVTLGYSITPKQQIKLTYEYLAQNLPFDYASGTVNEWVNQNALGGAYRYILDNGIVRALDVYGTYTRAGSKDLSNVEMYTDDVLTAINYRRIAGGTEMTAGTNITLTPFKNTIIKLGGGYSTLSFDTKWEDSAATAAIAYNAELSHLLTPTTLISTGIGSTASGTTYTTKVSQILPWSLEASLMGQYTATTNDIPGSSSVTAQLSYPAPKTYTNMFADGIGKLKDWVEKPVLYQTRVLAKAEERVVAVQITTTPIPPVTVAVGTDLTPPIQTKDYFSFNSETLDKINYIIASITPKNNTQITYAPNDLGLQIVPIDTYNAELSSASIMPSTALNPGIYTLTLQASGYRSGSVVSQVNNPVDITVATNPNLAAPTWIPDAQLPATAANANSYSADLRSLVKNNTGLADETYTFALSNNPSWLTLGGTDNQFLVLASGATVPANVNSASVDLNATSNTSDNKTGVQKFTIKISGTATGPVWVQDPNVVSIKYPQTAPTKIFVVSSQYVTTVGAVTASNFVLKSNVQPSNAIQNMTTDASGTYVTVNPPELDDIGSTGSFSLTATDSNGQSTGNFTVPIIASSTTDLTLPTWITLNPPSIPNATVGVKYESNNTVILNPYSSPATVYLTKTTTKTTPPTDVDDQLTFAKNDSNKTDACSWMLVDSNTGQLSGTPTQATQACTIYINVTSKAAGGQPYPLDPKPITVTGSTPSWIPPLTGNIPYDPITYSASKPFSFYIVPSAYIGSTPTPTISNIQIITNFEPSKAIKNMIVLDGSNGSAYVPIDPSNIADVYANDNQVTGQFSVDASSAGSPLSTGTFTITIVPNPTFTAPVVNSASLLPDINYDGTPYPVTINPYKREETNSDNKGKEYYISVTKNASGQPINDFLTFTQLTDSTTCSWAQITTDGVIQPIAGQTVNGPNCTVKANISSRATGVSNIYFAANINVGKPITWTTNTTTSTGVKFDDTTTSFTLNNFIQTGGGDPALDIQFSNPTSADDGYTTTNWKITKTSQGANKPSLFTLSRTGADAAQVGSTSVPITLVAKNSNSQTSQWVPGNIYIKSIDSDSGISFALIPASISAPISMTGVINPGKPLLSQLTSCVDPACTIPITNDVIDLSKVTNGTTAVTLKSGNKVTFQSQELSVNVLYLPNTDAGIYDLAIPGITSKAAGGVKTTAVMPQKFTVIAESANSISNPTTTRFTFNSGGTYFSVTVIPVGYFVTSTPISPYVPYNFSASLSNIVLPPTSNISTSYICKTNVTNQTTLNTCLNASTTVKATITGSGASGTAQGVWLDPTYTSADTSAYFIFINVVPYIGQSPGYNYINVPSFTTLRQ